MPVDPCVRRGPKNDLYAKFAKLVMPRERAQRHRVPLAEHVPGQGERVLCAPVGPAELVKALAAPCGAPLASWHHRPARRLSSGEARRNFREISGLARCA